MAKKKYANEKYTYEFPRPSVTVDLVVFTIKDGKLHVLLVTRKGDPFMGRWALPGGFVNMEESLVDAAQRELLEETGLPALPLTQLKTYSEPKRDPRGRVISTAFITLVPWIEATAGSDAAAADWQPVFPIRSYDGLLAFDHFEILQDAVERLRLDIDRPYHVAKYLCASGKAGQRRLFTLSELQSTYEAIFDSKLDVRNFRRSMMPWLRASKEKSRGSGRPAQLYAMDLSR